MTTDYYCAVSRNSNVYNSKVTINSIPERSLRCVADKQPTQTAVRLFLTLINKQLASQAQMGALLKYGSNRSTVMSHLWWSSR